MEPSFISLFVDVEQSSRYFYFLFSRYSFCLFGYSLTRASLSRDSSFFASILCYRSCRLLGNVDLFVWVFFNRLLLFLSLQPQTLSSFPPHTKKNLDEGGRDCAHDPRCGATRRAARHAPAGADNDPGHPEHRGGRRLRQRRRANSRAGTVGAQPSIPHSPFRCKITFSLKRVNPKDWSSVE